MKVCVNCKKVYEDEMSFCPYCGKAYHDYQDDVKKAMDELYDENPEESPKNVKKLSRVEKNKYLHETKTNNILNKVLIVFIVLLIFIVGGIGIYAMSNRNHPSPKDETPIQKPEVPKEPVEEIPTHEPELPPTVQVPTDNMIDVKKIEFDKEKKNIKIEIECDSTVSGEIKLINQAFEIGPVDLKKGHNGFYFLISDADDYTLTFISDDKTQIFEYDITKDTIESHLKKIMTNVSENEIKKALKIIDSSIEKCMKIQPKFKEGSSQYSLLRNRIKALQIVKCILEKDERIKDYSLDELINAEAPIVSIYNKTSKARSKYEIEDKQYKRFTPLIEAIQIAKDELNVEIDKRKKG